MRESTREAREFLKLIVCLEQLNYILTLSHRKSLIVVEIAVTVQLLLKYVLRINAFNCCNTPRSGNTFISFFRWANKGTEKSSDLPEATQQWQSDSSYASSKKGGARVPASLRQHQAGDSQGVGLSKQTCSERAFLTWGQAWLYRQLQRRAQSNRKRRSRAADAFLTWLRLQQQRIVGSSLRHLILWVPYLCINGQRNNI